MVNAITGFPSVADLQDHLRRLHEFRQLALDSLAQFDALLCPAVGWAAALPINPPQSITAMLAFQSLANTLTVPAGCLPSGCRVEERDMQVLEEAVNGEPIKSTDPEEVTIYKGYGKLSPTHAHMLAVGPISLSALLVSAFEGLSFRTRRLSKSIPDRIRVLSPVNYGS